MDKRIFGLENVYGVSFGFRGQHRLFGRDGNLDAIAREIDWVTKYQGALLAEALQESGGALSDGERAWADEVLGVTQRGGRSAA